MPESLVITTRQNVLDVVDHLRNEEGFRIDVEGDFTGGLKAIFYRVPEVVFIQSEINGISGEKVANQVKTLLDEEPIRLVLLRERSGERESQEPGFEAVIDMDLPFEELADRFRRELGALAGSGSGKPADSPVGETLEIPVADLSPSEGSLESDPFTDVFPAQFHQDWSLLPPAVASQESGGDEWRFQEPVEPSPVNDEFSFDPPGDIITSIPLEKPNNRKQDKVGLVQGGLSPSQSSADKPVAGRDGEGLGIRFVDKESPHQLFASMSDDESSEIPQFMTESPPPAESTMNKLRLKGVQTQSNLLKSESNRSSLSQSPVSSGSHSDVAGLSVPGSTSRTSTKRSSLRSPTLSGPAVPDSKSYVDGFAAIDSLRRVVKPLLILVVLIITTYMLVQHWDSLTGMIFKGDKPVADTPILPVPDKDRLPSFISPSALADREYPITHPGWGRYVADGIEYLLYRDQGRIRAIQIIAVAEGKISDAFVRMCIRETTGLPDGENWVRETRDDFQVEKGTLRGKGEVAVYRKMPEGEIRGVVLTFN